MIAPEPELTLIATDGDCRTYRVALAGETIGYVASRREAVWNTTGPRGIRTSLRGRPKSWGFATRGTSPRYFTSQTRRQAIAGLIREADQLARVEKERDAELKAIVRNLTIETGGNNA